MIPKRFPEIFIVINSENGFNKKGCEKMDLTEKTILVTGGTGSFGKRFIKKP